mgnify:FL=1
MVISKTFTNSFHSIFLAKMRGFWRRSISRYLLAAAMFSYGRYLLNNINSDFLDSTRLSTAEIILEGFIGFTLLFFIVILLMIITAKIQSIRLQPITIAFKEDELIITRKGKAVQHDWDWITSAESTQGMLAFLIEQRPRYEIFLAKSKLTDAELEQIQSWLILHGKLAPPRNVA